MYMYLLQDFFQRLYTSSQSPQHVHVSSSRFLPAIIHIITVTPTCTCIFFKISSSDYTHHHSHPNMYMYLLQDIFQRLHISPLSQHVSSSRLLPEILHILFITTFTCIYFTISTRDFTHRIYHNIYMFKHQNFYHKLYTPSLSQHLNVSTSGFLPKILHILTITPTCTCLYINIFTRDYTHLYHNIYMYLLQDFYQRLYTSPLSTYTCLNFNIFTTDFAHHLYLNIYMYLLQNFYQRLYTSPLSQHTHV